MYATTLRAGALALWVLAGAGCDAMGSADSGTDAGPTDAAWLDPCAPGDGASRECDDGNSRDGDGCSARCAMEHGYHCQLDLCDSECGDGLLATNEPCDDGNLSASDGCVGCAIQTGFHCQGEPSVCTGECGDGVLVTGESCDDGNSTDSDGCSSICRVDVGWHCFDAPSHCFECGNGRIEGLEGCDDGNRYVGDGCAATCTVEEGFECAGLPSGCTCPGVCPLSARCGDGYVVSGLESCDDGNEVVGDGCSAACLLELHYACLPVDLMGNPLPPHHCDRLERCGNGSLVSDVEECDDGNNVDADGCSADCRIEPPPGIYCDSAGVCAPRCGDGIVAGGEICDDGNIDSSDGCDSSCHLEPSWTCSGAPSRCLALCGASPCVCGDGSIDLGEDCDDGALGAGDGCDGTCRLELGWTCSGMPSGCAATCGDRRLVGSEQCDDGNLVSGDGCSSTCSLIGETCGGCGAAHCAGVQAACDDSACVDVVDCVASTGCAIGSGDWRFPSCWCGDAGIDATSCVAAGPRGACLTQYQAAAETTDAAQTWARWQSPAYPIGDANRLLNCYATNCDLLCF